MSRVQKEIDSLLQTIRHWQETAGAEATLEAEEILRDIEDDLVRIETPSAYRNHLLQHVKQEKKRFQLPDDHEDKRSDPLCDCSSPYCRLKRGKLPPVVTEAESIDEGITRLQAEHDGNAAVLTEGQDEWIEMTGEVRSELRRALTILKRDEVPEADVDDGAGDDGDSSGQERVNV